MRVGEGDDPGAEKISAGIVGVVEGVIGIEAADFYEAEAVDEAAFAHVEAHVGDAGRFTVPSAEKHEVSRLEGVFVIYALAGAGLGAGVARNNYVVHEQDSAHIAAAVHALRGHSCPDVREAVHGKGGGDDGIGTLVDVL